eukprot:179340_1
MNIYNGQSHHIDDSVSHHIGDNISVSHRIGDNISIVDDHSTNYNHTTHIHINHYHFNNDNNNNNNSNNNINGRKINGHNKSFSFEYNNNPSWINNNMPLSALYNPNEQYISSTLHHMDNAYRTMVNNNNIDNINETDENIEKSSLFLNENDNNNNKPIHRKRKRNDDIDK